MSKWHMFLRNFRTLFSRMWSLRCRCSAAWSHPRRDLTRKFLINSCLIYHFKTLKHSYLLSSFQCVCKGWIRIYWSRWRRWNAIESHRVGHVQHVKKEEWLPQGRMGLVLRTGYQISFQDNCIPGMFFFFFLPTNLIGLRTRIIITGKSHRIHFTHTISHSRYLNASDLCA